MTATAPAYHLYLAEKQFSSWPMRPWLLMRVLGIPFQETVHAYGDEATRRHEWKKYSPTAKVPVLHHGDTVIWDSLAITEYLAERHPGVSPGKRTHAHGRVARLRKCIRASPVCAASTPSAWTLLRHLL